MQREHHDGGRVQLEPDAFPLLRVLAVLVVVIGISAAALPATWSLIDASSLPARERPLPSATVDLPLALFAGRLSERGEPWTGGRERGWSQAEALPRASGEEARREHARASLGRFGWADRERGLVEIPIDEAMRLLVSEQRR